MKKVLAFALAMMMVLGCMSFASAEAKLTPGTYTATTTAMHGPMTVEVTVSEDKIESVVVTDQVETPGITDPVFANIPAEIVEKQTAGVDIITGATISSRALIRAVKDALKQAGDTGDFSYAYEYPTPADVEATADVIIVGGGGAGLAAAVSASEAGASVIVIEKEGWLGGNSIMAGGIYNCPDPEWQDITDIAGDQDALVQDALDEEPVSEEHAALQAKVREQFEAYKQTDRAMFDSADWYALQTWNGGDKVGTLEIVQVMADNAYDSLNWLKSMGMEFYDGVSLGGGSLYPRTHSAVMPNGTGYIKAFTDTLAGRDNVEIMYCVTGDSLIMDGDAVVGVNATGKRGNTVTLHANKGVILATGGFAGNVDLRVEYCTSEKWPDLSASVPTSNVPGVTGDGIFMAKDAGAALVNMDQIQLLPYCDPITGATFNISAVNIYINKEGKRYVREDGRRDDMSRATIAQTDGMYYSVFSTEDPSTTLSLGKKSVQYYLDNNLYSYVMDTTLEGLAAKIGVPMDAFLETIADFNAHCDSGEVDEFGRTSWYGKVDGTYYIAYPRKPAVHHTMGGVLIDANTHALNADGQPVKGLYCAGEITGVVHGANRLGGNAIVDFCVFGRLAGTHAAQAD